MCSQAGRTYLPGGFRHRAGRKGPAMTSVILSVPEISCAHCASSIVAALEPEAGVSKVSVDVEGQKVLLDFDAATISLERVKEILLAEEYPVEGEEVVTH